jgi:tetratricopeptide (TPR) repeat protein
LPFAPILLGLAAVAIGLVVGLTLLDDGGGDAKRAERRAGDAQQRPARERPREARRPAAAAPAATTSPATLNDEGFRLMNAGRYDEAIPVLQRAVAGFPEDSTDLTYAYALYNLGRSLRLGGRPAEAIPLLERRLRFKNQRGVVKRELAAARRAAGDRG